MSMHICNVKETKSIALEPTVTLNEVMQLIFNRTGTYQEPFCITAVSADKARNKGGELLKLTNMIVPTIGRLALAGIETDYNSGDVKSANHKKHGTINLINIDSRRPAKIHIDLILEFNGKRVI